MNRRKYQLVVLSGLGGAAAGFALGNGGNDFVVLHLDPTLCNLSGYIA